MSQERACPKHIQALSSILHHFTGHVPRAGLSHLLVLTAIGKLCPEWTDVDACKALNYAFNEEHPECHCELQDAASVL